jgi:antitoxin (DNA-binding transcriptional repressor) of toxin-antitoxin stability system
MATITVERLAEELPRLLREAEPGEEILLTDNNVTIARILPVREVEPEPPAEKPRRKLGTAAGKVWISPDFDAPMEEFAEYM